MPACLICQHPKREAIDAALTAGRRVGVVAQQFRTARLELIKHCAHLSRVHAPSETTITRETSLAEGSTVLQDAPCDLPECSCDWSRLSGYQRLLKAWHGATAGEKERFCVATRSYDVPF